MPVKVMLGSSFALVTPICAVPAARARSATRTSGRCAISAAGSPMATCAAGPAQGRRAQLRVQRPGA
jgi:hypothetical protein